MSATTSPAHRLLDDARRRHHPACVMCSPGNGHGLGLRFRLLDDGSVESQFVCDPRYESYPGVLHGGVAT